MKYLYIMLLCFGIATQSLAQQDSTKKSSLTLAAIYGNTANYFGQTTAEKLPYLLSYGAYKFKSGIYFSASGLSLINSSLGFSAVDVSGGYGYNLSENTEGSFSYTRSFFKQGAPLLQVANENNLNADIAITHLFKSYLSADYAFGTQNDMFLTFSNSKLVSLGSFSEKDFISIEPGISVIGGTQRFYETYTIEKERRKKLLDPRFPGRPPESETTTIESTNFGLLAYIFSLPLAYNRSNYSIEASYQASMTGKKIDGESQKPVSILNFGVYYQF